LIDHILVCDICVLKRVYQFTNINYSPISFFKYSHSLMCGNLR
jgi:hypothetical protein